MRSLSLESKNLLKTSFLQIKYQLQAVINQTHLVEERTGSSDHVQVMRTLTDQLRIDHINGICETDPWNIVLLYLQHDHFHNTKIDYDFSLVF